jgi:hypothetical protein
MVANESYSAVRHRKESTFKAFDSNFYRAFQTPVVANQYFGGPRSDFRAAPSDDLPTSNASTTPSKKIQPASSPAKSFPRQQASRFNGQRKIEKHMTSEAEYIRAHGWWT